MKRSELSFGLAKKHNFCKVYQESKRKEMGKYVAKRFLDILFAGPALGTQTSVQAGKKIPGGKFQGVDR